MIRLVGGVVDVFEARGLKVLDRERMQLSLKAPRRFQKI